MNTSAHIGPFALADRIGEGGMGTIYRGVHRNTGVSVAVKVIRHGTTDAATRRFHREIQAHAELQHPNVVYLFEYGEIPPETADRVDDDLRAGETPSSPWSSPAAEPYAIGCRSTTGPRSADSSSRFSTPSRIPTPAGSSIAT